MKTNFRKSENSSNQEQSDVEINSNQKNLTQKEFEDYLCKSGAKGSFMVYRSTKTDEELGLDEL